jgi:hypothetical protein
MEQSLNYSSTMRISLFFYAIVRLIFSQEVELTKDTAEVKLILSIEDQFYFGLPIIHYNRSRQEYHKISFQQVFQAVF